MGNQRLVTSNLYNNIDLMCSSNQSGIKYYFIVKPGGDPKNIQMEFTGASSFSIDATTKALSVNSSIGSLTYNRPVAYQLSSTNATLALTGSPPDWATNGASNKYQFNIAPYTHSLTLVIEVDQGNGLVPQATDQNLDYSTYVGGSGFDNFYAVKVNQTTNRRYVAGTTSTNTFPAPTGLFSYVASNDGVILGYSSTDSTKFATFYGGTGYDVANNIAIESNGNIYVTGKTQSVDIHMNPFTKTSADQQGSNGISAGGSSPSASNQDGFILELNYKGNIEVWSRYLGGVYIDEITAIKVDAGDNLYLVGKTNSGDFPIKTATAYKSALGGAGSTYTKNYDWFVMKLNSQSTVLWSTYYGGDNTPTGLTNTDGATCVDVDPVTGDVYVGGSIYLSTDFPQINLTGNTSSTAFYSSSLTGSGAALVRFNSAGSPKLSTQLQSLYTLNNLAIAPDRSVLMLGIVYSGNPAFSYKTKANAYNHRYSNTDYKGVILQMNSNIDSLWATYFCHTPSPISFNKLAMADNGGFCIAGTTNTDTIVFPATHPAGIYVNSTRQDYDGFISYFDSNGGLLQSHFFGGSNTDNINDIDFYKHQSLYAVGETEGNFETASTPANVNLIDPTYNSGGDGFVSRFEMASFAISVKDLSKETDASIKLYPNPVTDYFLINTKDLTDNKNFTLSVYDLMGKEVFKQDYSGSNDGIIKVSCNSWSNGLYLINVISSAGKYSGKIIKQ